MRLFICNILILLFCFQSFNAYAFDFDAKPVPSPEKWTGILGEYVKEDIKIIIREDGGSLHAIVNPNGQKSDITLAETSPDHFSYYDIDVVFSRDQMGQGSMLKMGDDTFHRIHIEPRDGQSFKVEMKNGLAPLLEAALNATPPVQKGDFREPDLVDITTVLDNVKLDIRYATTNNFLSVATYSQAKSFLQRPAVLALNEANKKLNKLGYGILVHDAYRPWYVTKIFWDATEGPERDFVANPQSGSKHNMGSAIDLTLYELNSGEVVKMVGTYDEMSDRSYPDYMGGTSLERWHRDLLRTIMEAEGFKVVSNEWWHFDHKDWQKYPILNKRFGELDR